MARYRRGDGHYADVECSNAEFERYLVLSCNELERKRPPKLVALVHAENTAPCLRTTRLIIPALDRTHAL